MGQPPQRRVILAGMCPFRGTELLNGEVWKSQGVLFGLALSREVKATVERYAALGRETREGWGAVLSGTCSSPPSVVSPHQPPDFPVDCGTKFRVRAWNARPERG